jgi:hypothetical protein
MLKRLTINRVDPVSAGKVFGIVSVAIGIMFSLVYGAWLMIELSVRITNRPGTELGIAFATIALFMAPLAFGVFGSVLGLLMAVFHNIAVGYFGGLVLEAEDDSEDDGD